MEAGIYFETKRAIYIIYTIMRLFIVHTYQRSPLSRLAIINLISAVLILKSYSSSSSISYFDQASILS